MKAIIFNQFGNSGVLQQKELPIPNIQPDEILVRVHYAGVSPFDLHVRDGWYKDSIQYDWPIILGWELSGTVIKVGDPASEFKAGNVIVAHKNVYRNGGAYAEYVAVKASEAALKPDNVSDEAAAAVSMNALTAWQALFDVANLTKNQKILIHAAAGGVGHLAVQLAKWAGAYVIGTASEKNKNYLLSIGLDEFIDYQKTDFSKSLKNIDVVLDTIGNETLINSFKLLKKNGLAVSIVDFENIKKSGEYQVRGENLIVTPNKKQLTEIMQLVSKGILTPHITTIFDMADAAKAQDLLASGHVRGKVLIKVIS